ncbi:MAG: hypothetical protein IAG13_19520 [Deltaproteobacteria bacterium]|nr:hypothetical protein [Nannocystaceae bacterium]
MSDTRTPKPSAANDSTGDASTQSDSAESDSAAGAPPAVAGAAAEALARELAGNFRGHVRRALGIDLDGSITSLAFVDHYLRSSRDETRAPIVTLVAAEAGAYFGELVREHVGASWVGDAVDPRRLRLLMSPQFLYCSPIDQALEALLGPVAADDERLPEDSPLDTAFHARSKGGVEVDDQDDESWLAERLAELPPVSEQEYYTLTCRFETLQVVLELLAARHSGAGESPREYTLRDYVDALTSG